MMSASTIALFFASLAFIAIATKARTFSSDESWHNKISIFIEYGRALGTPPPSPKSEPLSKQITNNFGKDVFTTTNYERARMSPPPSPKQSPPESQLQKPRVLPPPPPASSKPPTESENTASPCVTANPCSSSSTLIVMVTDQDYGRTTKTPPPSPKASPPTHYDE
ncbi:hypothetical protein WN943_022815 [Citrus x changshan-huyou]|uniref:proline-rich receptor-like protein kinase PERK8 n=1 Tax=Citrus sinensis TaxID=2711 RepID=UPI002277596F|nr:proline-rich receptor-like protein kinase PERK8 [Citrus sinensis]